MIEIYLLTIQFEPTERTAHVRDPATFGDVVKGAVAVNFNFHTAPKLQENPRVVFCLLFGNIMALYAQVSFFTIPQRLL